MKIALSGQAKADIAHWNRVAPARTAKIQSLLVDAMQTPYSGLGKPEALKHGLVGYWSRRIDREHRLIYKVEDDTLYILSCRYHYR